jgi:hypothetical protein
MPKPAVKADFIRSQPIDMPIKDLQRAAKRAGHGTVGKSYATKIRATMTVQDGLKALRTQKVAVLKQPLAAVDTAEPEQKLREIVVVLGTARVRQIIDQLEAQLIGAKSAS